MTTGDAVALCWAGVKRNTLDNGMSLTPMAATQWMLAGNHHISVHDGQAAARYARVLPQCHHTAQLLVAVPVAPLFTSAHSPPLLPFLFVVASGVHRLSHLGARCFAKALLLPAAPLPCAVHVGLGRAVLESMVDLRQSSPAFGQIVRQAFTPHRVRPAELQSDTWLFDAAQRVVAGVASLRNVDGIGAVVGAAVGRGWRRGASTDKLGVLPSVLTVSEVAHLPYVLCAAQRWLVAACALCCGGMSVDLC